MSKNNSKDNKSDWDKVVKGAQDVGLATAAIVIVDKVAKWLNS